MWQTKRVRTILVTGFEPFGAHSVNPTEGLAKAVDGRRVGDFTVLSVVLPVHHADAGARLGPLLAESNPEAVLHLGLAGGRARIALERVALNVMDYEVPDNAGYRASGEPCVAEGPPAYFSTLPLPAMLKALVDEGMPAYTSNTAGTYLCNQTLYWTLHAVRNMPRRLGSASSTSRCSRRRSRPADWSSRAWTSRSCSGPSRQSWV